MLKAFSTKRIIMKKLFFAAVLLCGAIQLKAQEQTEVKTVDAVTASINKEIQDQTSSWKGLTSKLSATPLLAANQHNLISKVVIGVPAIDNMPVAVLKGNSKMPVAKFNGLSKMPIAKSETIDVAPLIKQKLAKSY